MKDENAQRRTNPRSRLANICVVAVIIISMLAPVVALADGANATDTSGEKPRMAIFFHDAHLRSIRAFDEISVNDRPVDLSIYRTLNAAEYVDKTLNLTGYSVIIVRTAGHAGRDLQVDALLPILGPARDVGAEIIVMDVEHNISTVNVTKHPDVSIYFGNLVHFNTILRGTNAHNLLNYVYVTFMNGTADVHPPVTLPMPGIYHPDAPGFFFDNTADYLAWAKNRTDNPFNKGRPTVGVLVCVHFTSGYVMDGLVRRIEQRGANVIIVYPMRGMMAGVEYPDLPLFRHDGNTLVDAVISLHNVIRSVPDDIRVGQFKELDVPVLGGISLGGMFGRMTPEEWKDCIRGVTLDHVGFIFTPKELLGVVAPTVIAGMHLDEFGARVDIPIPEQVNRLVDRAINHAELSHTPNEDKNIAIIHFGYAASGLNIHKSLAHLLSALHAEGYTLDPMKETEITEAMLAHGRNIGMWAQPALETMVQNYRDELVLIPISEYRVWFEEMIPEHRRNEVLAFWGEPVDGSMVVEYNGQPHFVIPMIETGNIMILPQPARGGGTVDEVVVFHDAYMPPSHKFIAFYLWLQRLDVDAIIHFGTHGTQEWLPGKERGLAADCWPSLMSGTIPIIYPYIVDNVGEAVVAQRRGDAVIVTYMTPQLVAAGLYGDLRVLHDMIHHYEAIPCPVVRDGERRLVIEEAIRMSVDKEMGMPGFAGIAWDSDLTDRIHLHIHKVESQVIPVGLHILGEIPNKALINETVLKILGPGFTNEIIMIGQLTGHHECHVEGGARAKAKEMLYLALRSEKSLVDIQRQVLHNHSSEAITGYLEEGKIHLENFLLVEREIESIASALSGGFIPPGPGGDPIRNPESLPTGRNLYSFDPREVPTRTSWEIGRDTLRAFLDEYRETNGEYPDKIAFVLFAGETMRHRGVAEAQILYALGVEPQWDRRGRVRIDGRGGVPGGLQIIPDDAVGRPRIDVVITMTCLYRDTFSCRVELVDAAVRLIAAHAEDGRVNHVRENYLALKAELRRIDPEMDAETVDKLALARIFGPASGAYGLGLGGAVKAGGTWDERGELGDFYLNRMGNIYSADMWGESNRFIFEQVLRGVDAAIFSRSSNLYGLLSTDHPFEFLGGLSMAIEHVYEGGAPQLMITDLRNPHTGGEIASLNTFLRMELRARPYNPRWIKGLMEHGFSGAGVMSGTLSNLWGWQVVTPDAVTDDMWNELYAIYIQDKYDLGLEEFFEANNPWAQQSMMARMLETIERGFWEADEAITQDLLERFIESVARHGPCRCAAHCANARFDRFIAEMVSEGKANLDRDTLMRFDEQRMAALGEGRGMDLAGLAPTVEPPAGAEVAEPVIGEIVEVERLVDQVWRGITLPVVAIIIVILLMGGIGVGYLVIAKKRRA